METEINQGLAGPLTVQRARRKGLAGFYKRNERSILGTLGHVVVLALWQAAWSAGLVSPMFFSGPSAVAESFVAELGSGRLLSEALFTWRNFFIGFLLALAVAVPAGVCIAWYRHFGMLIDPVHIAVDAKHTTSTSILLRRCRRRLSSTEA